MSIASWSSFCSIWPKHYSIFDESKHKFEYPFVTNKKQLKLTRHNFAGSSRQLRLFSHPTQTGWDHETFVIYRMSIRSKSVCNCVNQNNIRANCCPCNKRIKHGWEVLSVSCPQPSCCPCLSTRFPLGEGCYLAMKQCIIQQMLSSLGDSTFIDHIYISQLDCSYIENLVLINLLSS